MLPVRRRSSSSSAHLLRRSSREGPAEYSPLVIAYLYVYNRRLDASIPMAYVALPDPAWGSATGFPMPFATPLHRNGRCTQAPGADRPLIQAPLASRS